MYEINITIDIEKKSTVTGGFTLKIFVYRRPKLHNKHNFAFYYKCRNLIGCVTCYQEKIMTPLFSLVAVYFAIDSFAVI